MVRKKKKEDEPLVVEETKRGKRNVKPLPKAANEIKRRKIQGNDDAENSSELKTKPNSNKNKNVNTNVKKDESSASKKTKQRRKISNDVDSETESKIQLSTNKRPKRTTTKKSLPNENEPKLKKCKMNIEKLDIKQEVDHSENENSSGSSADSGCLSDPVSKVNKNVANVKLVKVESPSCSNLNSSGIGDDFSSSESEWEEVEENEEQTLENYNPVIPKEGVEITIDCPDLKFKRRKKKEFDEMEWTRLYINRMRKEAQLNVHKCHLLFLLGHGLFVNDTINSSLLQAISLSLIPIGILDWTKGKKVDKIDVKGIEQIIKWFRTFFRFEPEERMCNDLHTNLTKAFETKTVLNASEYNVMFIIITRVLGLKVRFCMSLYPLSHKASNLIKKRKMKSEEASEPSSFSKEKQMSEGENKSSSDIKPKKENLPQQESQNKEKCNKKSDKELTTASNLGKNKQGNESKNKFTSNIKPKKENDSKQKSKVEKNASVKKIQKSPTNNETKTSRSRRSTGKNYKISSDESGEEPDDDDFKVEEEKDFEKPKAFRKSSTKTSKQKSANRKILSDSDSDSLSLPLYACYHPDKVLYWAEIFSKPDKKWISVECVHNIVNDPYEIEAVVPQPISYIISFDNSSHIKDVTKRYCKNYMTFNIKQRVVPDWWDETLAPFAPPNTKLDKEEEENIESVLINQPLPHTVSGFKNHPLYALKRHLLKFEAIYPPDAAPVGFIRKEPVYLRENVVQLHSRETWLKEARVVRIGEEPYKIVKARPKWDRIAGVLKTDLPLDIFGFWQTEPYEPPIAVDGKVPRNEYGNVELFKPCMLPRGTVHIQLPGINRVAKKLGIDCSPAVVGFDGHKGSVHPVFEGFVVCEEFKDTIIAAWEEEQENIRKREEEKREKRIYGNWKKLIKGLLIRERIKLKYDV
ncbi:DNA repair protein complementing XP-C cells like protein [Argiope bruennichi]|uniref:DNA repair protein complementing XP-C cells like protein n=1 Tax=Argiope bruennichi TaxID=94029 RepID=A0A8T0FAX5_ARGBR|nr:DNA repair protein complementing XP-C cells like protein [Argiope bruennichi]